METKIIYNGVAYRKHPKQKYYYCASSKKQYSRCLHRQMWYDAYGEIPEGMQVHHINHDSFDNRLDNFELVERSEHSRMHAKKRVEENPQRFLLLAEEGRKHAPEWHKSEEGRAWHIEHAKRFNFGNFDYGTRKCDHCDKEYKALNSTTRFCSNNCKSKWRRKNKPDVINVNCEMCGSSFETMKYTPRRFCSSKCRPTPNPLGYHAQLK